jgi:hypothetical protein
MEIITQIAITVFSCTSIFLFSTKSYYRYGFIAGIVGQPFWIYSSYSTGQWGIFLVSLWFTVAHIRGLKNHFIKSGTQING